MTRVRLRFSKLGKVRFTSHRDVARMWERALRRVELPVVYSEGFSPRPRLHFGLALSTGHESLAEYVDVDLRDDTASTVDIGSLPAVLSSALPAGIDVTAAAAIPGGTPSLQHAVTSCSWRISVVGAAPAALYRAVERVLAAEELVTTRQRKGHDVTDDLRPLVVALAASVSHPTGPTGPARPTDDGTELTCELATQPRGLRPAELVALLGDGLTEGRVLRTHQWIQHDGARQEPLAAQATSAPHAEARAS